MSLEKLASDHVILTKNEEAINELQRLGIKLPSSLSRLLHVIDNRRTFKQCVTDPRLAGATDTDESLRSLIRLGLVNAIPAASLSQMQSEPNLTATTRLKVVAAVNDPMNRTQAITPVRPANPDAVKPPPVSAKEFLKTTWASEPPQVASETSSPIGIRAAPAADSQSSMSEEARAQWESEVDARHLETVKGTLVQDLRQILGRDVLLVQGKILSANNGEQLIRAVTACSRVLEAAVSKEASEKLMDAFRRHFS
jgi:hypothetical protein